MAFLRSVNASRIVVFLLLTAVVIGMEIQVTHTDTFSRHPAGLSMAVLVDLVFVTTGLFYWLVARPRRLANSRLILMALLMLRVALFILPKTTFSSDPLWPLLLILAEGTVLIMAVMRIRTLTRTYQQLRLTTDSETALQRAMAQVFGERVAGLIIGEGLTLYYVLLGWRLRFDIPAKAHTLTTHRQSGQVALTVGLLLVGLIEGVGIHLLLTRWSPTIACWVTGFSAYGLLFFLADLIASVKRPSYLTHTHLHIRLGVRWRGQIALSMIADVSLIHEKPAKQPNRLNGAFLTAPNILLTFHEPVCFAGPYGIRKTVRQVSFFVDDRDAFVQALNK